MDALDALLTAEIIGLIFCVIVGFGDWRHARRMERASRERTHAQ